MQSIFQKIILCALALAFACAGESCMKRETAVQRGNREQVLLRGVGPEIATLDPQLAAGTSEYNILSALLEGLVSENPVDLSPEPGVAESWTLQPDGRTYTFVLRTDARWSNGDPVTAADFVASYKRILTPEFGASGAAHLYVIQNAEAYHKGQLADFSKVGVSAADARTLRITLEHPCATFLAMLNQCAFLPVHMASIEKNGLAYSRANDWARPEKFIGNGAFILKDWKLGQKITVEKSPIYWDAARVRLNGIEFLSIESRDAEERAFRAGQLHLTEAVSPSKIAAYRRNLAGALRIDPYLGTEFYRINTARPFLSDVRIRRALSLAIDRTRIVEKILRGGQKPALAFTPPGMDGYEPPAQAAGDSAAARALLAEAGYAEGKGAPPIELLFNTSESHRAVAEAVQEMWRRELGFQVVLVNQENKTLQSTRQAGDYQLMRASWIADYVDPASFLGVWTSSSGDNYTGWSDATYDQLLYQAARTPDAAARNALLQKAEALVVAQAPFLPIYYYTHVFLIQPSVKNWNPTVLDHHPYKYVYLETGAGE